MLNVRLSAWVSTSDLLNEKESGFGEFIFRKFIKQNIFSKNNAQEVLQSLKRAGVNGIELLISSNTKDQDIQIIRKMLRELDIRIFSVHQSVSTLFNISIIGVGSLFKIANELSVEVVVLHISSIGDQIFDRNYVGGLKDLENKYKIKIGIENMPMNPLWFFKTYTWKENEFSSLIEKTGFHITFDTTHLAQTGGDIIDFYKKNKSRIINIHLSDYKKNFLNNPLMLTYGTHLPLGRGQLPIGKFLKTLKETDYNGIITMEINGTLPEILRSARVIKRELSGSETPHQFGVG